MVGYLLFSGLLGMLPIVILLVVLMAVVLRQDDDGSDERAPAFYGAVVAMLALLTCLIAVTGVASGLTGLTEGDDDRSSASEYEDGGYEEMDLFGSADGDNEDWRAVVAFAIAGGAATALLVVHRPLLARRDGATGVARRVFRSYLAVMCLVTAIAAAVAAAVVVFDVFKVLGPGVFGNGNRDDAARDAIPPLVLFLGAAGLWRWHWQELGLAGQAPSANIE